MRIYALGVQAAGGDHDTMLAHVPIMLGTQALRWLQNLPPRSIYNWDQFYEKFIANFRSTCQRSATERSLARVYQGKNKSLKSFVHRFSELKNQVADIPDHAVITHFKSGLHDEKLLDKLSRKPPTNVESCSTSPTSTPMPKRRQPTYCSAM